MAFPREMKGEEGGNPAAGTTLVGDPLGVVPSQRYCSHEEWANGPSFNYSLRDPTTPESPGWITYQQTTARRRPVTPGREQMQRTREFIRTLPYRVRDRIAMRPAVQRALLPFGRDLQPERWIFIVGCYNSGTTLLANILREHQQIGGLPTEGVYLSDVLPYPEQFGWPRNWSQCADRMQMDPCRDAHLAERIRRQWSIWAPSHKPNLVEKSIANAARLPFLEANFRPAWFIYIVRNGYAVASGIRHKANVSRWKGEFQGSGYPIRLCAQQWRVSDETVARDCGDLSHFLQIYYEDLVARPREVLERVTDFIGVSRLPADTVSRTWQVHGVVAPINDMNESALANLSEADIAVIEKEAGERLAVHGYPRPVTIRRDTEEGAMAAPAG